MNIQHATQKDLPTILDICAAAFPEEEQGGIAILSQGLLAENSTPACYTSVAKEGENITGYIMLSPVIMEENEHIKGYILAPLAVHPSKQRKGIGAELITYAKTCLQQAGVDLLLVYGDPKYYSRFGFTPELAQNIEAPFPLQYPFGWQALLLQQTKKHIPHTKIRCVPPLMHAHLW